MKSVVQRYLASNFVLPFSVSLLFFVTFLLTFQMFRIIRFLTDRTISASIIFGLIAHIAVSFLPIAVPLASLFATVYTMNKLSEDSEIVSMRSFGFSRYRLFFPFFVIGIVIASTIFVLNQTIIPHSQRDFKNGVNKLTSKGLFSEIKQGNFFTEIPNITLFAEKVGGEGKNLEDVFIQSRSDDDSTQNTIFAKRGFLVKQNEDSWGRANIRLLLSDGNIVKEEKMSRNVEKILFGEYDFPLISGNLVDEGVMKDSMRTNDELMKIISMTPEERQKVIGTTSVTKIKMEYWSRYTPSLESFLFILLGFALGVKQSRGRGRNSGPIILIVLVGYYALFFFGMSLAKKGALEPMLAVFTPAFILATISGWLFSKLDWVS